MRPRVDNGQNIAKSIRRKEYFRNFVVGGRGD